MLILSVLGLLSLPALSSAVKTVTACVQTCGELTTVCTTVYDTTTVANVSTITTTNTIPSTITISATETTHVLVTVKPTPGSVTTTLTSTLVTTTTLANVSSVLTVTDTITDTSTNTITATATTTDRETVSTTVTTTVTTTPAGFRPISDTLNFRQSKLKRDPVPAYGNSSSGGLGFNGFVDQFQAKHVVCEIKPMVTETRIVFSTATLNSTVTATRMTTVIHTDSAATTLSVANVTVSTTVTVTSTSTQGPSTISSTVTNSVTTTKSVDSTITNTVTTSTTTTMTFTSTSTANGACQTNNILGPIYQNQGVTRAVSDVFNNGPNAATVGSTISVDNEAEGCCNACTARDDCTGYAYLGSGICVVLSYPNPDTGVCIQDANAAYFTYTNDVSGGGLTIGNGLCGFIYQGSATT